MMMEPNGGVTHARSEETMEAKARWFRSLPLSERMDMLCSFTDLALPLSERMDMLCSFTDLALSVNPALQERKDAQPVAGRIQVISAV